MLFQTAHDLDLEVEPQPGSSGIWSTPKRRSEIISDEVEPQPRPSRIWSTVYSTIIDIVENNYGEHQEHVYIRLKQYGPNALLKPNTAFARTFSELSQICYIICQY